jgi:exosortase N
MGKRAGKLLFILLPIIVFWVFNHRNIPLQFSLILGVIAFPYVVRFESKQGNYRFAIVALISAVVLFFVRSGSLYYFSSVFIVLFVLDRWWGRINLLPVFLAIAVSPVISNVVYIWSFPIRLKLTSLASTLLNGIGMNYKVDGNILSLDSNTFSVDPACIGLKLVITSVVIVMLIISFAERKTNKSLPVITTIFILSLTVLGSVVSNFIRLLTLIVFYILPENPMHDVIGILSLFIYVLVPMFYFTRTFVHRYGQDLSPINKGKAGLKTGRLSYILYGILIVFQIFNGPKYLSAGVRLNDKLEAFGLPGFSKRVTEHGVLKLQSDKALIYIKPPVNFYQGSHDPRYCWQGSGYTFSKMELIDIGEREIFTALLTKDGDTLYSAWWYQSKQSSTPHEWDWRTASIKGEGKFYLINISCTSQDELNKWIDINYSLLFPN